MQSNFHIFFFFSKHWVPKAKHNNMYRCRQKVYQLEDMMYQLYQLLNMLVFISHEKHTLLQQCGLCIISAHLFHSVWASSAPQTNFHWFYWSAILPSLHCCVLEVTFSTKYRNASISSVINSIIFLLPFSNCRWYISEGLKIAQTEMCVVAAKIVFVSDHELNCLVCWDFFADTSISLFPLI